MPRSTKVAKVNEALSVIAGLTEHFPNEGKLSVGGKAISRAALVAIFQGHLDAIHEVEAALAAFQAAVRKERAIAKRTKTTRALLRSTLRSKFGTDVRVWADFGLKLAKKPGPKTVASKLAGVRKREAARGAK
jgi:hypothetical protein